MAWVQDAWARIRPFSTGGNYVNFQLADAPYVRAGLYASVEIHDWQFGGRHQS